jgi:hypothetical protein
MLAGRIEKDNCRTIWNKEIGGIDINIKIIITFSTEALQRKGSAGARVTR